MSVESIARRITASENGNILDDYYRFYNDGKWVVDVARRMSSTLAQISGDVLEFPTHMPKFEECIGYMEDAKVDELGTVACAKELKKAYSDIKKAHSDWENASEESRTAKYDDFVKQVNDAKGYADAFLQSCVNAFRNRYVEDEENVRGLLDAIHSAGNAVMNGGNSPSK